MSEAEMPTPTIRPRRLRRTPVLRGQVRETRVVADQLVMPHFVAPDDDAEVPVVSMPGIDRTGVERLLPRIEKDLELGIRAVLLFGVAPDAGKDERATPADDPEGCHLRAIARLREAFGDELLVIGDVCLCGFTEHGHCGIVEEGEIRNDASVERLVDVALAQAEAGVDIVAPSDMMDGRVAAIRAGLDAAGHTGVGILSYAVKYASGYYGPFRDAADSSPSFGDRRTHQMDPANVREAIRESLLDENEGADMLMVKPALAYLDVIRAVRERTTLPLAAYNVSGEYSAVKAAAERGWLEERAVVMENLVAMRRAGADVLITYHARAALEGGWL